MLLSKQHLRGFITEQYNIAGRLDMCVSPAWTGG